MVLRLYRRRCWISSVEPEAGWSVGSGGRAAREGSQARELDQLQRRHTLYKPAEQTAHLSAE